MNKLHFKICAGLLVFTFFLPGIFFPGIGTASKISSSSRRYNNNSFAYRHRHLYNKIATSRNTHATGVCTSKGCQDTVREIIQSMNKSVNPCENFYAYACQGWEKNNPRPSHLASWNVYGKLDNLTSNIVAGILSQPAKKSESENSAISKAKLFFKGCMQDGSNTSALELTWNFMKDYGGWPLLDQWGTNSKGYRYWNSSRFNLVNSLAGMQRKLYTAVVLDIYSYQNPDGNVLNNFIVLDRPSKNPHTAPVLITPEFLATATKVLLEFLSKGANEYDPKRNLAADVIKMQSQIIGASFFDANSIAAKNIYLSKGIFGYNDKGPIVITTLNNLQAALDYMERPRRSSVQLYAWLTMLYKNTGVNIQKDQSIYVGDVDYLFNLAHYLSNKNTMELANYIHSVMAADILSKTILNLARLEGRLPWQNICTQMVQQKFNSAIMPFFIKQKGFKDFDKIQQIFQNVKKLLIDGEITSPRPEPSKTAYINFYNSLRLCNGYPSWINQTNRINAEYSKLHLTRLSFLQQLLAVNEWAMTKKLALLRSPLDKNHCGWSDYPGKSISHNVDNLVYMPLELFQAPYFDIGLPRAMLHGKLGYTMGHEITHGLLRASYQFPVDVNINGNSINLGKCVENQYGRLSISDVKAGKLHVNGAATLEENYADNLGLQIAYRVHKEVGRSTSNNNIRKPKQLERYTDDQLFFLGFAQHWCALSTPDELRRVVEHDVYPPEIFRVLGTLQNSQEFADAWKCPAGSVMNPRQHKKCTFFL